MLSTVDHPYRRHHHRPVLRPAAASTLGPDWLHGAPVTAQVVAVFEQAVYLRRDQDVLPLLAPQALLLPGGVRVASRADLHALDAQVGDQVLVGDGQVLTRSGGLVVRRTWRPQPVPSLPLPGPARERARAALDTLASPRDRSAEAGHGHGWTATLSERLTGPAAAVGQGPEGPARAVVGLVGLGPGLTPAGDDVLCGLLLGLRATGDDDGRAALAVALAPLVGRTTALSASLLRHAAQGYGVPPLVALLRAWHRDAALPALVCGTREVAAVGHSSGPALLLGLSTALTTRGTS